MCGSSLAECPSGEMWQQVPPGELGPCERTCREPNATETWGNCSAGPAPGCVCQHGHLRNQAGLCVPAHHCECWRHGRPHPVRHHSPSVPPGPPQPRPPSCPWAPPPTPGPAAARSWAIGHRLSHRDGLWAPSSHLPPETPVATSVSGRWFQGGGRRVEKSNQQRDGHRDGEENLPHSPQPGSEWQEACESCRCLRGRSVCTQHCAPLTCAQVPTSSLAALSERLPAFLPGSLPRGWS